MKQPLRMVPFEQLMLHLDRPNYPNVLAVRLHFRGEIQRALAIRAFEQTRARHPLADAVLDPEQTRFISAESPLQLEWCEPFAGWPTLWQRIVRSRPQVLIESDNTLTRLTIAAPHALTDGLGGLQFAQDWMTLYHQLVQGEPTAKLTPLNPDRLADRGNLRWARWRFLRKLPLQAVALFGASKFLWRKPAPLVPVGEPAADVGPLPPDFPQLLHVRIPAALVQQLRAIGRRQRAGQHELLLAWLFAAIARWRERRGGQKSRDWIRLLVPLTTRKRSDQDLPSCNQVTIVQIDRTASQCGQLESLAPGIAHELGVIRRWELDRTMLFALQLAAGVPGQIRRMARSIQRRATCIATYMGRGFLRIALPEIGGGYQVGDLQLHDLEILSPLLPGTPASFAFLEFRGEVIVSLHADGRVLPLADAQALLVELQSVLGSLADFSPDSREQSAAPSR